MDWIFDFIAIAIFDRLGGYKQKLQPGNANRIRHNTLHRGLSLVDTLMGHYFHIAPDVIGQHNNLKKGVVIFKLSGRNGIQTLAFGLSGQVFNIGALIVFSNHFMRFTSQTSTKNPVDITIIFKKGALNRLARRRLILFGNSHGHKPAGHTPTCRLVDAAVVLDIFSFPGPIPSIGIKGGPAAFIGNDKFKPSRHGGRYAFPT